MAHQAQGAAKDAAQAAQEQVGAAAAASQAAVDDLAESAKQTLEP